MRAVPRICEFYPGICLTTEEKARKNLRQGKKNLSQVKKNLSQSTVYILPKHPHITKPSQTHILQTPHIQKRTRTHTHTHTLQNKFRWPMECPEGRKEHITTVSLTFACLLFN